MLRIQSLAVLMLATSTVSAAQQSRGSAYHDPNGRFTIAIPTGWEAAPQGDALIIKHGTTYVVVSRVEGAASPQDVIASLAKQYGSQWRDVTIVNRGDFTLAGGPASYVTFSGTNPRGVAALLRMAGVTHGSDAYAFVFSGPRDGFIAAQSAIRMIEGSFSFGGGSGSSGPGEPGSGGGFGPM